MRKIVKMSPFTNVVGGGTATLSLPIGLTYDKIHFQCFAGNKAHVERLEVEVDGKVIQTYERGGVQINELNKYYGRILNDGAFTLYFNRPELNELSDQRMFGLGTVGVKMVTIKVKLAAVLPANFELNSTATMSEPKPMGAITKIRSFPKTFSTAGELDIDSLPMNGARIAAVHLYKAEADINKCRVLLNNVEVFEASAAVNVDILQEEFRDCTEGKYFHIDFMKEGDAAQSLITAGVHDLRIKPDIATSGQIDVLVEYIDGLQGAA
ncbi:MAG: hypothetical protein HRU20_31710 [Pseudomonadales bacterium]|nr:hypothetical protein [Pseudomonadales bacterium]